MLPYQILALTLNEKIFKKPRKNSKFKLSAHGITNLNYFMEHILYLTFKMFFGTSLKKHETANSSRIRTYVNGKQN